MPPAPTGTSPPKQSPAGVFIRGGGGTAVGGRRIVDVLMAVCAAALVVVTALLGVSAAHRSSEADLLHRYGVPVQATVTGCVAISSGVGMGIEYWQCRATYTLDGTGPVTGHDQVIRGSRSLLERGQTVPAVAVPGHPALLSTPQAASRHPSGWSYYRAPAITAAAGVLLLSALGVRRRRRRAAA